MNNYTLSAIVAGGIAAAIVGYNAVKQPEPPPPPPATPDTLTICSFNNRNVGSVTTKEDSTLALIVSPYDIVVVQELTCPPDTGTYPDGTPYEADPQAKSFFDAMAAHGYDYLLSTEDTGPGENNHNRGMATEWFVTFYRADKVQPAPDLPIGFLADDRSDHPDYERVPFALPFRTRSGSMDFVLISVHLKPGPGPSERARRRHELASIASWVDGADSVEKDFIILGDMNIYKKVELDSATPAGFVSLNDQCSSTTTKRDSRGRGKPYDHVMYRSEHTDNEVDTDFDIHILDLVRAVDSIWNGDPPCPTTPYDHNVFSRCYSDHQPIVFRMIADKDDDGPYCDLECPKEKRTGARCRDGYQDGRKGRGACSGHGGVECWECEQ